LSPGSSGNHAGLGEVEVSRPIRQQHRLDILVGKVAHQLDEESADAAAPLRLEDLVIESDTNWPRHRTIIHWDRQPTTGAPGEFGGYTLVLGTRPRCLG
jgi:hypothetical protein